MKKQILLLVAAFCFCATFAYSKEEKKTLFKKQEAFYQGGFTTGFMVVTNPTDTEAYLSWGYFNDCFLFNFGVNAEHQRYAAINDTHTIVDIRAELGGRARLFRNLFVTYGALGSVSNKNDTSHRPWGAGVFSGLDLQITRHFLLSAKLAPFEYQQAWNGNKIISFFETASVGFSYVY